MVSDSYIYANFLEMSQLEILEQRQNIMADMKRNYLYDKMMNQGTVKQETQKDLGDEQTQPSNMEDFDIGEQDQISTDKKQIPSKPQDEKIKKDLKNSPEIDSQYKPPQKNRQLRLGKNDNPLGIDQKQKKIGFPKKDNIFGMQDLKQMYGKKPRTEGKKNKKVIRTPLNKMQIKMLDQYLNGKKLKKIKKRIL